MQKTSRMQGKTYLIWVALVSALFLILQAVQSNAQGIPRSFADLAEQVSPAVVNITTSAAVAQRTGPQGPQVPPGSPFEDLFRDFFNDNGPQAPRRGNSLGSGFIISADGLVVTNNHVIEDADEITVELFEGGELKATLLGTDPTVDIALLKVESDTPLPFVEFGDSDIARVGDWVMAVGNPLGQGFSVSTGIISARNRELQGAYDDYIQTDAAINRGNSGGPLFNMDGEVVGVNTAIISPNGGSIGLGFSMSSNVVSAVVDQLQEFGETRRGWLGVRIQDLDEDTADALGLASTDGALVSAVPEGPAMDAGIEARDVIVTFNGEAVEDTRELIREVGNAPVGETVPVTVLRDGSELEIAVTLGRREDQVASVPAALPEEPEPQEQVLFGIQMSVLTEEIREQLSLPAAKTGVMVMGVEPDSDAFDKGLRAGDLITEVGPSTVASPTEVETAINNAREAGRDTILLRVERQGNPRFVALNIAG
ncbi:MAG: Do family serine endopeptidase [Pseudomonadota bacterium]